MLNNTLFYGILYFIGVRKKSQNERYINENNNENKLSFFNIVKRVIVKQQNNNYDEISQPREITRLIYNKKHNADLSPPPVYRSTTEIQINHDQLRDIQQQQQEEKQFYTLSCCFEFLSNWSYSFIIFSILLFQPINTIYIVSTTNTERENVYLSNLFFQFISPFQYFYSIQYFNTDHFETFYFHHSLEQTLNKISLLILFISMLNVSINIIRLLGTDFDGEFPQYYSYSETNQYVILVFLLLSWIYANIIIFTNLICFCLVFIKHSNIIHSFSKRIQEDNCNISLNQISQELINIIYQLKTSISHFEVIFSSFTFWGAISFGFFIDRLKSGNFDFFPWNTFIIYIILQCGFFFIILNVTKQKDSIDDFIKNPKYIHKYIKRYTVREIKEHFSLDHTNKEQQTDQINLIICNLIEENATAVDWILLQQFINSDWAEFKFFGLNISNFNLIKKSVVVISFIFAVNQLINF